MRAEETDMGTRDWGGVYGGLEKTEWEPQASKKASFPYIMCFRQVRAGTCRVREGWPVTIIPIRSMLLFSRSVVSDSVTPWTAACQASPYFTISWSLHKFMSNESVMPSNHLILCHPLLLLPSIFPSIRVFSNESVLLIRWPMYWSFSFSISPSNEYSGLTSFRTDRLDLAVQESSQAPQFEDISSLALSLFYCPALTSTHDYWKNHSFDYTDLCGQSNISDFLICCLGLSFLFFQGTSIF